MMLYSCAHMATVGVKGLIENGRSFTYLCSAQTATFKWIL